MRESYTGKTIESALAVILAGGQGTRVRKLHPHTPKPMIRVSGRPFLDWVLLYLLGQGVRQAIISTGYLSHIIQSHCASTPVAGLSVTAEAEPVALGTAGGFLRAAASSRSEILICMNGDSLVLAPLSDLVERFAHSGADAAVVGVEVSNASRYGTIVIDAFGHLVKFGEKQPGKGVVNAGIYLFRRRLIKHFSDCLPLSFETDVFPRLIATGYDILGYVVHAAFLDIGTPESLAIADRFIHDYVCSEDNGHYKSTA